MSILHLKPAKLNKHSKKLHMSACKSFFCLNYEDFGLYSFEKNNSGTIIIIVEACDIIISIMWFL